ncbi:lipase 3-like [Uranotaenia lowii]|uniref:lipase 3-like n=1 Tax=Uranotaenia lowii TaxID=190385 RepID=UPI00247B156B|nr:lipase 3-like [Uranotaenia lowii]
MGAICWWIFFAYTFAVGSSLKQYDIPEDPPGDLRDNVGSKVINNDLEMELDVEGFQIEDIDGQLTVPQLITKYGYQLETHRVTTEDGYILTMFRILPRQQPETPKYPVLIVHGLLGSSADFVVSGPNHSLAYYLSDSGYDVWLANVRGTRYSKDHTDRPLQSREYWDFSWHEMGYYDIPSMIDYILNSTSSEKLQYIGHSQGTTSYFAMSCSRPEYNDKVVLVTALAPAVILKQVRSPILRLMLRVADTLKDVLDSMGVYEFLPYNPNNYYVARSICPKEEKNSICSLLVALITGPHPEMYDEQLALAYMGHAPAGASTKQLMHFVQLVRSGLFRQFDYGKKGNLQTYSNWKAPQYNFSNSKAPVQIFYGLNDWMVHPRDVEEFSRMLPNLLEAAPIVDKKFNHLDFLMAKNARQQVYDKMLPVMERYNRV